MRPSTRTCHAGWMRQNPLGRSGLTVSAVGLGCNNFGRRLDLAGTRAVIDAALDARHHALRHGRRLRRRRRLGAADRRGARRPARPRRAGDQVRHGRGRRRRHAARLARLRAARDRGLAASGCAPTGSTSTTTTSPTASPRSPRRSARSASWPTRARSARSASPTSTPRSCARRPRSATSGSRACRTSTTCSSAAPRPSCCRSARELGIGFVPVLPARERAAHGQVPARRGRRRAGTRLGEPAASGSPTPRSTASRRSRRSPHERGHTLLELAIAGLASQPGVASVIAGAMRPEQVAANAAAGRLAARRRRPRGAGGGLRCPRAWSASTTSRSRSATSRRRSSSTGGCSTFELRGRAPGHGVHRHRRPVPGDQPRAARSGPTTRATSGSSSTTRRRCARRSLAEGLALVGQRPPARLPGPVGQPDRGRRLRRHPVRARARRQAQARHRRRSGRPRRRGGRSPPAA